VASFIEIAPLSTEISEYVLTDIGQPENVMPLAAISGGGCINSRSDTLQAVLIKTLPYVLPLLAGIECLCVVWSSVFGLVCDTDAVRDNSVDSIIMDSLLATATESTRRRTALSDQHFSDVRGPLFAVDISQSCFNSTVDN